jgi:signal transduction histidine kinase
VVTEVHAVRRNAIAEYEIVGGAPEPHLDNLVELAAAICGVPTAVINIIDDTHQHQVASIGFEAAACLREDSMCAVVLHEVRHVWVTDARLDERFALNPFVTGEVGNVVFYASSPVVTPAGVPIGTLCVFDEEAGELTDQQSRALDVLAHQVVDVLELRRVAQELERSNEALAHFASQVSHDLRNPLTALSGFLELAEDDPGLPAAELAAESVARARGVTARMTDMVIDLLNYARAEGAQPRRIPVDIAELVHAVVEDLDAAIEKTGATVSVDADAQVTGDPTLLRALIQNLIANSIKFTNAAGIAPRVEVRAEHLTDAWRITVDDNGPGVVPADRERVFELMERGVPPETPGLGIGLSTCRRIAETHGGRIGIDDSPIGGARVWVELPDVAVPDVAASLIA